MTQPADPQRREFLRSALATTVLATAASRLCMPGRAHAQTGSNNAALAPDPHRVARDEGRSRSIGSERTLQSLSFEGDMAMGAMIGGVMMGITGICRAARASMELDPIAAQSDQESRTTLVEICL
jgi:hypothetical protein